MPFTDKSDIFGAVHEEGINRVVRHIMRQRPSLFNYATPFFRRRPDLLCVPIQAAQSVIQAQNPLFTVQDPLPIVGSLLNVGLNYCIQLTDLQIDFHPGNSVALPRELGALQPQRFALRMRACAGIDCPSDDVIADFLGAAELETVRQSETLVDPPAPRARSFTRAIAAPVVSSALARRRFPFDDIAVDLDDLVLDRGDRDKPTLPTRSLLCVCLELFAVAHFEWGTVGSAPQQWLKPRLDGIEIVDLQPTPLENAIECYMKTVLKLGIFPRLMLPLEAMILDITQMLSDADVSIGEKITLKPTPISPQLPHNPAIEQEQVKAFISLVVEEA
jgi:hypothetical protein